MAGGDGLCSWREKKNRGTISRERETETESGSTGGLRFGPPVTHGEREEEDGNKGGDGWGGKGTGVGMHCFCFKLLFS